MTSHFDQSLNLYSDLHKDVYGFRPRNFEFSTVEEIDAEIHKLCAELDVVVREEEERAERCWQQWLEYITGNAKQLQVSVARMIQWDMQAEQVTDLEDYCWAHSLSFAKVPEIRGMLG